MPYYINPVSGTVEKITKAQKGALDEHRRAEAMNALLGSDFGVASVALSTVLVLSPIITAYLIKEGFGSVAEAWEKAISKAKKVVNPMADFDLSSQIVP